jgi:hypothetical protein
LNVKREGHLTLHVGNTLIEVLVEGTLLVAAYQDGSTIPVLEYSGGTAPEPKPMLKLRPTQAVPAFTEPKPKPAKAYPLPWLKPREPLEPVVGEVPHEPEDVSLPFVPPLASKAKPKPAPVKLSAKTLRAEYSRIITRKSDLKRMDLLLRLLDRAERISGRTFTTIDPKGPFESQKELFFAEVKAWWNGRTKAKPQRISLGKDAPPGHTPHNYLKSRITPLVTPKTPEALAARYREYNAAMGTNHPIPGNMSLADAFEHLKELVRAWHGIKTREFNARKNNDRRAMGLRDLFNGNTRVTS